VLCLLDKKSKRNVTRTLLHIFLTFAHLSFVVSRMALFALFKEDNHGRVDIFSMHLQKWEGWVPASKRQIIRSSR